VYTITPNTMHVAIINLLATIIYCRDLTFKKELLVTGLTYGIWKESEPNKITHYWKASAFNSTSNVIPNDSLRYMCHISATLNDFS